VGKYLLHRLVNGERGVQVDVANSEDRKRSGDVAASQCVSELLREDVATVADAYVALLVVEGGGEHRAGPDLRGAAGAHQQAAVAAVVALA